MGPQGDDATCGMEAGPDPSEMGMACGVVDVPSSICLTRANSRMHDKMAIEFTCDTLPADFLRGMIPHHQGAIDMCNILLKFGDPVDPALRTLCLGWESPHDYLKGVIPSQTAEIQQMRHQLAQYGHDEGTRCGSTSHGNMTHADHMADHMASDMSGGGGGGGGSTYESPTDRECGITFRVSDTMPSKLKFGVSVGDGADGAGATGRRRRLTADKSAPRRLASEASDAPAGGMFGCGDTSCLSSRCMIHENEWMHHAMTIELSGEINHDFVQGMLAHHQGEKQAFFCLFLNVAPPRLPDVQN